MERRAALMRVGSATLSSLVRGTLKSTRIKIFFPEICKSSMNNFMLSAITNKHESIYREITLGVWKYAAFE
ncbi:MAG: hypothetical protein S4CHLAM123_04580 [Chlamydiales bacterium]|nr:hypothetical protein [Chlamydiales bacterium]